MARNKKTQRNTATDCSLNQETLDFLKLGKQPFGQEILSSDTYYNSPELEKITETLKHQAQFSDLLLIIEGAYGSGKTSLFRQIIQADIPNIKLLPVQAETTDTLIQIQQKISIHLQDMGDANHLDSNLKSLQAFDQTPLLILDDAHVLSDTTLQELFRYQQQLNTEHDVNLKFSFFANPGLSQTLEKITDIQAGKIYTQIMPAYTGNQTEPFIQFKLNAAGYSGEPLLDDKSFQLISKNTNGTALNSMHLAADLIEKQVRKITSPSLPGWIKGLIISLTGIAILAGLLIYLGVFQSLTSTSLEAPLEALEKLPQSQPATDRVSESMPAADVDTSTTAVEDTQTAVETFSLINNAADNLPETTSEPSVQDSNPQPSLAEANVSAENIQHSTNNSAKDSHKKSLETKTENIAETEAMIPPSTSVAKTKPALQTTQTVQPEPEKSAIKTLSSPHQLKALTTAKKSHLQAVPALQQLNEMGLHDANWLKQQDSSAWTIQLLGAREPETLLQFSRTHQLKQNAAWYKTWLKGQPYYVLVYSTYSSRDQARSAIEKLPGSLRNKKPWVKSIKAVQQAIK